MDFSSLLEKQKTEDTSQKDHELCVSLGTSGCHLQAASCLPTSAEASGSQQWPNTPQVSQLMLAALQMIYSQ